ncbi:MAG: V-type ATPase subunit [Aminipila sp.]
MSEQYTYAVARIRVLEVSMLSDTVIEQLLSSSDYQQALQLLIDKGWGDVDTPFNAEAILNRESEKIWEVVKELNIDMNKFNVLNDGKLYHNLKAAIKQIYTGKELQGIFYENCKINGEQMLTIVREKAFEMLPKEMQEAAVNAYEALMHAGDGQLCDIIIDKACLDSIMKSGKESKDLIIKDYAESVVAVANIKVAVRACMTGKSAEFMKRAMAECESLSIDALVKAALAGMESIKDYLSQTVYAEGAEALSESASAFERWCDNRIIETIQPQKYKAFTIGPIIAYVIARQNEIKTVRIILSGKQNDMPLESIRERVRKMYV